VEGELKVFACVRWSFGQCYYDRFVCLLEARTNGNGGANADNNKSCLKSLILSDYSRIQYYKLDPPKIGCNPITNVISYTHHTVSVKLYWELTHQANPNIYCTPW
jgi:hypothetical protein